MNIDTVTQTNLTSDNLEEKLSCIFADVGAQIGEMLQCIINQQISAKFAEINQLNALLNGGICNPQENNNA